MGPQQESAVKEFSKVLFGNSLRLEVLGTIAEQSGPFIPHEIADALGVADNLITGQLARLVDVGLVSRTERYGAVAYERSPSVVWRFASELRREVGGHVRVPGPPKTEPALIGEFDLAGATAMCDAVLPAAETYLESRALMAFRGLVNAAVHLLARSKSTRAVGLAELTRAGAISRARLSDVINDMWPLAAEAVIRALPGLPPPAFEEIASVPVRVSARNDGFGVDARHGVGASLHALVTLLTRADLSLVVSTARLAAGTRDDPSSDRADRSRIAYWSSQPGASQPRPFARAVKDMLATSSDVIRRADGASSPVLVMGPIQYGPPRYRSRLSGDTLYPGHDRALIRTVEEAGRVGLLYAGPFYDVRGAIVDPKLVAIDGTDAEPRLFPSQARYLWSRADNQLIRIPGSTLDEADVWRVAGAVPRPAEIISVVEHIGRVPSAQVTADWAHDLKPGRIPARAMHTWDACMAVLNVAYAALSVSRLQSTAVAPGPAT